MSEVKNAPKSDFEEIFDETIWKEKIKGNCFICGVSIPKTWQHYFTSGNCCGICSGWAGMSQQAKRECRIKDVAAWRALTPMQRNEEKNRINSVIRCKNKL